MTDSIVKKCEDCKKHYVSCMVTMQYGHDCKEYESKIDYKRLWELAEARCKAAEDERNELMEMIRIIPCQCNDGFTSRKLTDPSCPRCNWATGLMKI